MTDTAASPLPAMTEKHAALFRQMWKLCEEEGYTDEVEIASPAVAEILAVLSALVEGTHAVVRVGRLGLSGVSWECSCGLSYSVSASTPEESL